MASGSPTFAIVSGLLSGIARYSRSRLAAMLRQSIVGTLTGVTVSVCAPISARDVPQAKIELCQCMRLLDLRKAFGDSSRRLPSPGVSPRLGPPAKAARSFFSILIDNENWEPDHHSRTPNHSRHTVRSAAMITGPRKRPTSPNDCIPPRIPISTSRKGSSAVPPIRAG
jgi:hypothetical protein